MNRLQKVMAHKGVASRRASEKLISEGKVKVNGKVVTEMGYLVSDNDIIEVNNKVLEANEEKVYYVLNKPTGYLSTVDDPLKRRTIMDLLGEDVKKFRVYPVGRLDYDTAGVLLITNDGEFMNKLTSPKSHIEKEYLARVDGIVTKLELRILEKGVELETGYTTRPCKASLISIDKKNNSCLVKVIITEGKNHQVRLMLKSINHEVKKLTRVREGVVTLENLSRGSYRKLKIHEVKSLMGM